jgi:hypothetical protein
MQPVCRSQRAGIRTSFAAPRTVFRASLASVVSSDAPYNDCKRSQDPSGGPLGICFRSSPRSMTPLLPVGENAMSPSVNYASTPPGNVPVLSVYDGPRIAPADAKKSHTATVIGAHDAAALNVAAGGSY